MAAQPQVASIMARQLIQKLAGQGGGAPGGAPPPGMPPGGPPQLPGTGAANAQGGGAGAQISQQMAELNGADPQLTLKILNQIKSMLVALYPRTAFSVPGVARNVAQAMKYIDNGIKEAEQAAATAATVQPPIANSTGITPQQPEQGGLPGLQSISEGAQ